MIWFIVAEFVLVAAAGIRWTRVAQAGGYEIGCVAAAKKARSGPGGSDRISSIAVTVVAVISAVIWPLSLVAAALWLWWPRSLPLFDRTAPLVWDRKAVGFFATSTATLLLLLCALMVATVFIGFYFVALLPLVVVAAAEWALRMGPRTVDA